MSRTLLLAAILSINAFSASNSHAVLLAGWTFELSSPTNAGPHAAELGVNAGFASQARGSHLSSSTVYSNSGNGISLPGSHAFRSNRWAMVGDFYEFRTSTLGYQSITIQWDQFRSSNGTTQWSLQYSNDGANFTSLGGYLLPNLFTWYNFGPTAGPATLDNQANVYFRLVINETVVPSSSARVDVDNILIEGTEMSAVPEASTILLLGLGAASLVWLRRFA